MKGYERVTRCNKHEVSKDLPLTAFLYLFSWRCYMLHSAHLRQRRQAPTPTITFERRLLILSNTKCKPRQSVCNYAFSIDLTFDWTTTTWKLGIRQSAEDEESSELRGSTLTCPHTKHAVLDRHAHILILVWNIGNMQISQHIATSYRMLSRYWNSWAWFFSWFF